MFVGDARLGPRRRAPRAPGGELHGVADAGVEPGLELGHAPELADPPVREMRGDGMNQVRRHRRAGEHDVAKGGEVHPLHETGSQAGGQVRGPGEEVGRAKTVDRGREGGRRERGEKGDGGAGGERHLDRIERIEMPERRRGEDDVAGPDVVLGDAEAGIGQHLVIVQGDALGARARPGRVEQQEGVGRGRLPPVPREWRGARPRAVRRESPPGPRRPGRSMSSDAQAPDGARDSQARGEKSPMQSGATSIVALACRNCVASSEPRNVMYSVVITAPRALAARKTSMYSRVFGSWTATTSPGRSPAWWSPAVIDATRASSPAFETVPCASTRAAPSGFARALRRSHPERVSERQ